MRSNGFTLIEMTTAVLVIGMMAGMAVPPLVDWQRNMELSSSMDQFERMHALTRITAIREGRVAEMHIDTAATQAWIEVDTSGTGVRDTVAMITGLEQGVSMSVDRAVLCFDGRGLPTTAGACDSPDATLSFTVAANGQADTTRITLLGKVIR